MRPLLGRSPFYYKAQSGFEVDFVTREESERDPISLTQVCIMLHDAETKHREIRSLAQAYKKLNVARAKIRMFFTLLHNHNIPAKAFDCLSKRGDRSITSVTDY